MSKIIVLKCVGHNPKDFELEEAVAVQFGCIKDLFHSDFDAESKIVVDVPVKFNSYIIGRIVEFCSSRASFSSDRAYWEQDFFHPCREPNQRKRKELIAMMEASEYLGMESLVELTTQSLANYLKGKNPLTIRSLWKVEGDLTAEEEAKALAMGVAKLGH
ncbi:hypothetical protein Bca4012_096593 [Brassica carinata]|uniref:SKP1 component dimerisation domain-containing protein n=3 Tax=Brassica TaxID=3705 RepID=A0A0D3DX02_BRAOL|nr:PREDICTED: SKP1-like protein 5 [Brassica oleracea var. oleracea]KAF3569678.1 hypothetical protein F2Q69_00063262 [Brassica cretica]VDD58766.1 unnamed protein product [Brassica oleracea]